jgi:hypothetical protein
MNNSIDSKNLVNGLKKPEDQFYPMVMWYWNDKITKEEITYQIRQFKMQKIYNFFVHPAINMQHDYLSDDYFQLIVHAVNVAKEEGLKFWIYDEYNWPSGCAGGKVLKNHKWAKDTSLKCKKIKLKHGETVVLDATKPVVAVHFETSNGVKLIDPDISDSFLTYTNLDNDGELVVTFKHEFDRILPASRGNKHSLNIQGYVDLMNQDVTKIFFEYTHDAYKKYIGDEFGKTVIGVFTDEPCMTFMSSSYLPYTESFFEVFKERCGYDAREKLYLMYKPMDCEESRLIKKDWYETCSYLFEENFIIPYKNWCSENNLLLTGHLPTEEEMNDHVLSTGSLYKQLRHFHAPGIDTVSSKRGIRLERFDMAGAFAGSIAHFARKERVLCETYTGSGWDLNVSDIRKIANRLMLYGINMLLFMGAFYTVKGLKKARPIGYPPTHNHLNPQFQFYGNFCEYVSKFSYISAKTYQIAKTLILYPYDALLPNRDINSKITHFYQMFFIDRDENTKLSSCEKTSETIASIICVLRKLNRSFEIGFDEAIENAKIRGNRLLLAGCEYEVIIVPYMHYIRKTTASVLKQFIKNGGKVIFVNDIPKFIVDDFSRIDFIPSDDTIFEMIEDFSDDKNSTIIKKNNENIYTILTNQMIYATIGGLCDKINECYEAFGVTEDIEVEGKNIISNRRKHNSLFISFLFNEIDEKEIATIKLNVGEAAIVLDINTMTISDIFRVGHKKEIHFNGHDGKIVFAGKLNDIEAIASEFPKTVMPKVYTNKLPLNLKPYMPYNLYRFKYKMVKPEVIETVLSLNTKDMENWLEKNPNMCFLREKKGPNSSYMAENQAIYPYIEKGKPFIAITEFYCCSYIEDIKLCTETLYGSKYILNGKLVENFETKRILHPDDQIADVSKHIKIGRNSLIVIGSCVPWGSYHCVPFAVLKGSFYIENGVITPFKPPTDKDITKGGYPFFAGTYSYKAKFKVDFKEAILKLKAYDAVIVKINGKHVGDVLFSPYELDISKAIKPGDNEIELIMRTKLMNIFDDGEPTGITDANIYYNII